MERVFSLDHYGALVREIKSRHGRPLTNSYLLPGAINDLVQRNALFWEMDEAGLFFFAEENSYYQMYFYIVPELKRTFTVLDKPTVINLVYRTPGQDDELRRMVDLWMDNGFIHHTTTRRMVRVNDQTDRSAESTNFFQAGDYHVSLAGRVQLDAILRLWKATFDVIGNALPSEKDLACAIEQERIVCAVDGKSNLVGALECMPQGRDCMIQHVAVEKEHRKRGLAGMMLRTCYNSAAKSERFILWVAEDNQSAINLYLEYGFTFDHLVSIQLIQK